MHAWSVNATANSHTHEECNIYKRILDVPVPLERHVDVLPIRIPILNALAGVDIEVKTHFLLRLRRTSPRLKIKIQLKTNS